MEILNINNQEYKYYPLKNFLKPEVLNKWPYCLKILLENLIRRSAQNPENQTLQEELDNMLNWQPKQINRPTISFLPSRVVLQDFTGVPAIVDLAAMRDAMKYNLKSDPKKINPLLPVDLVIDHSVVVDRYGDDQSLAYNIKREFERNYERYQFLKWGQQAFSNLRIVPPGTGIVHQVNLEYLSQVVFKNNNVLYPDTGVGTDSHTPMVNGLGVLAWGVGGIEAEAAMLGQAFSMVLPPVVGFKLTGELPQGATATDLVLTITEILRKHGVVNKFVEFYGPGLDNLTVADRATVSNMSPEYGATCGIFPIDSETLTYLKLTGRNPEQINIIEKYAKEQSLFRNDYQQPEFDEHIELDLKIIQATIAGPKKPHDKTFLSQIKPKSLAIRQTEKFPELQINFSLDQHEYKLTHNAVVIAAITSCTNTSNPEVMLGAGLLAKKAIELGLKSKPWVKTSLAPGSKVVTDYIDKSGLTTFLNQLGFYLVGYGCTTCIGNSGALLEPIADAISKNNLCVTAVLSSNRNFEGRIHPLVKQTYLASPLLVVAYAIVGTIEFDFDVEPLGYDSKNQAIFLKDIWPTRDEIKKYVQKFVSSDQFKAKYSDVFTGEDNWHNLQVEASENYAWQENSTYIKSPPFFTELTPEIPKLKSINNAYVLAKLGDMITTDHISPAGTIPDDSPAGIYLESKHIEPWGFNSYGSRRGNHEVMLRGTLANIRLKNQLAPGNEGGFTRCFIDENSDNIMSIYEAAMKYQAQNIQLILLAGKEYGTGSSRDWAAKGIKLLGVRAIIAESYERIHRSNLIGMGILPLVFLDNQNCETLGLTGFETYDINFNDLKPNQIIEINATPLDKAKAKIKFQATVSISTESELEYYRNGGILNYVMREMQA